MNIEAMYINASQIEAIASVVLSYFKEPRPDFGSQANAPLPSSYDQLLRNDPKRKIVISQPFGEWCYVIESKEVVDFSLAIRLSKTLNTTVLIIQISTVTGGRGFAILAGGEILKSDFFEDDKSPEDATFALLDEYKIKSRPLMFKEAVQKQKEGWLLISSNR